MQISQAKIIMGFLKLLLLISLISTAIAFYRNDSDYFVSINYNISVEPYIERPGFSFSGESYVNFENRFTRTHITLDLLGINITSISLTDNYSRIYNVTNFIYIHQNHIVVITFHNALLPGFYKLHIKFINDLSMKYENGLYNHVYRNKHGQGVWVSQKSFPTIAVRRPYRCTLYNVECFQYRELPATFNISVRHNYGYNVLSNMPILRKQLVADKGMIWTHFDTTPRMLSTSIMIVVFNFICLTDTNSTVNIWSRSNFKQQMQYAHSIAIKVVHYMTQYVYLPKVSKTDFIAMPNFPMRYLANKGIIFYDEKSLTYDNLHPVSREVYVASLITDGLLNELFDNMISSDSWLLSGIIIFYRTSILNEIFPKWRLMDLLVVENLHGSLCTDNANSMEFLDSEINNYRRINISFNNISSNNIDCGEIVYSLYEDKAPVILRMLQHVITEKTFRESVKRYLQTFQFRSIRPKHLWTVIQTVLKESLNVHRKVNITEVMDTWIKQKHYPVVMMSRDYESGRTMIWQKDSNLLKDRKKENKWWIPMTFTTQNKINFTNTLTVHWLNPLTANFSLYVKPEAWIIVNLQQTGYYRVNYDTMNWMKIARYMQSRRNYKKIHVLNRAQLIDDAFYFMINDNLDSFIFFNISTYLRYETDYIAWYPMFKILFKLQKYFDLPESKDIKLYIAEMFNTLLEDVRYEDIFDSDNIKRLKFLNATHWACTVGNTQCLKMASAELKKHIADPNKRILTSDLYHWIYCFGLKTASKEIWDDVWDLYEQTHDRKIFEYLTCSEDPVININFLITVLENDNVLDIEKIFAFRKIITKHIRNDDVFNLILNNLGTLKPKWISTCEALKHMISNTYSETQFAKIKNFTIDEEKCITELNSMIDRRKDYIKAIKNEYFWQLISRVKSL